jgi:hypothetical protein
VSSEGRVDSLRGTGDKGEKSPRCSYCKKTEHLIKDCRKRLMKESMKKDKLKEKDDNNDKSGSVPSGVVMSVQSKSSVLRGWIFDSGATDHFTNEFDDLEDPKKVCPRSWGVANGSSLESMYMGNVRFGSVLLTKVYYCENVGNKVLSESRLVQDGGDIHKHAESHSVVVVHPTAGRILEGQLGASGHFELTAYLGQDSSRVLVTGKTAVRSSFVFSAVSFDQKKVLTFHQEYGHLSFESCFKMLDIYGTGSYACV